MSEDLDYSIPNSEPRTLDLTGISRTLEFHDSPRTLHLKSAGVPQNTIAFHSSYQELMSVSREGVVKIRGEVSEDPAEIGKAFLEWVAQYMKNFDKPTP